MWRFRPVGRGIAVGLHNTVVIIFIIIIIIVIIIIIMIIISTC